MELSSIKPIAQVRVRCCPTPTMLQLQQHQLDEVLSATAKTLRADPQSPGSNSRLYNSAIHDMPHLMFEYIWTDQTTVLIIILLKKELRRNRAIQLLICHLFATTHMCEGITEGEACHSHLTWCMEKLSPYWQKHFPTCSGSHLT